MSFSPNSTIPVYPDGQCSPALPFPGHHAPVPSISADIVRDFNAPEPTAYDASAGTITANGLLMLSTLLSPSDPSAGDYYLGRACKLIDDTLRECSAPRATIGDNGDVNWGEGGWESVLMHLSKEGGVDGSRYDL